DSPTHHSPLTTHSPLACANTPNDHENMAEALTWFSSTIWPWVIVVVHGIVVVVASAHVVLTKRDARSAIGWVGIIWLTPILGTVLYFTFGINRIQRKARHLRRGHGPIDSAAGRRRATENALHRALGGDGLHLTQLER